jgi:flagellar hook-associated protein 2
MADLGLSGLASGFDWKSVVDQLTELERFPQRRLRAEQSTINRRKDAIASLVTELESLKTKSAELAKATVFTKRTAKSSDDQIATISTTDKTPTGTTKFEFTQLATASFHKGASDVGANLYTSNVTSSSGGGPILSAANFITSVTAGTFNVNGQQVSILTTDTLQEVFGKIETATGNAVTASYDATTDKISLTSASSITLGSAADSSNFLQVARLTSGGATVTSSAELGRLNLASTLASNPFKGTTLANGGDGSFKVNGVEITYTSTETAGAILQKITDSSAGVDASYDALNDQIVLTNKLPGDMGIALEDVGTNNFLAAAKITTAAGGALTSGQNVKFKVNGGAELTGLGNTITEIYHGIAGLTVNALQETDTGESVTITIGKDTSEIKKQITDFVDQYNKIQSLIDTQTASSTDANGKVTAGILATDRNVAELTQLLRSKAVTDVNGVTGVLKRLESLGFKAGGFDNKITLSSAADLDNALTNSPSQVQEIFTKSTDGIANRLNTYLETVVGVNGSLVNHRDNYATQSVQIDTQVIEMEKRVISTKERLTRSFLAMEEAQGKLNQQMQFLQQRFK